MKTKPNKRRRKITDSFLNSLPLHELLAIGLRDLKKQERAKNSVVDMHIWLRQNGECSACLAGSVMRFSCGVQGSTSLFDDFAAWAHALNRLRMGLVAEAMQALGRSYNLSNRRIAEYEDDPAQFWREMRQLHADLKAANL